MPRYEYRCRTCAAVFEQSRPMSHAAEPARCPGGHEDSVKLLSTVALADSGSAPASAAPTAAGGGGCCGGGCCG